MEVDFPTFRQKIRLTSIGKSLVSLDFENCFGLKEVVKRQRVVLKQRIVWEVALL